MEPSPYTPPKSEVKDLLPEVPSYRIRTSWFYLVVLAVLFWAGFETREALLQALTVLTLTTSLALTILLSVWPLQVMAARRSSSIPWWWNSLLYCVVGVLLFGAIIDDPILMFVGFVPIVALSGIFVIASWLVEVRYSDRVYSTANGVVFVKRDDGL